MLGALVAAYAASVAATLWAVGLGRLWHVRWHYPLLDALFVTWAAGLALTSFASRRFLRTFTADRIVGAAIVWLLVPIFCDSFTSWKQAMWFVVPFNRDPLLHAADVWLHGGRPPFVWLLPALTPGVLRTLDIVYALWFLLTMGTLVAFAWAARSEVRHRFLLAVVLVWTIIGSLLAGLGGSGGPCYYRRLVPGADPYAPLFRHLDAIQGPMLAARRLQESLWGWMQVGTWHDFSGISAMPSVHVAMATTVALAWSTRGRAGTVIGVAFVFLTLVGSVALGWHYAVDGYVGGGAAILVWWAAGGLARRQMSLA